MISLMMTLALASAPRTHSNGNAVGEFKGYQAVNAAIAERWFEPGTYGFQLSQFFGDDYTNGLASLLGGFQNGEFRNGAPNALNMMLWYIGMNGLASAVEKSVCVEHKKAVGMWSLNERAYQVMSAACAPAGEQALMDVWLTTVSYDAPRAEFEQWRDGLDGQPLAARLTGALLDPYFLLEH
jgi:hypothetical protein